MCVCVCVCVLRGVSVPLQRGKHSHKLTLQHLEHVSSCCAQRQIQAQVSSRAPFKACVGWPEPYTYTVYNPVYGNSPPKNTVHVPYIRMYVWFGPILHIHGIQKVFLAGTSPNIRSHTVYIYIFTILANPRHMYICILFVSLQID